MMTTLQQSNPSITYTTPYALSFDNKKRAEQIGLYRQQEAIKKGSKAHLYKTGDRDLDNDVWASYAEILMARLLDLESSAEQAYVRQDPKLLSGPDVGERDEVRCVSTPEHNLIFRPRDDPQALYWLVYYDSEKDLLWVRGWRYGWEIRDNGTLRSPHNNPFWTYDYDKLRKDHEAPTSPDFFLSATGITVI